MAHKVYQRKARYRDFLLFLFEKYELKCWFCLNPFTEADLPVRKSDNLTEHHIDGDHSNWDIDNRVLAHTDCHKRHHLSERRASGIT
jgi:5-methylcytosine-specific restriction endonuclease McrA